MHRCYTRQTLRTRTVRERAGSTQYLAGHAHGARDVDAQDEQGVVRRHGLVVRGQEEEAVLAAVWGKERRRREREGGGWCWLP